MAVTLTHIFSPVIGLLLNAVIQVLGCRYINAIGLLPSVFIGFFCGILCVLTIEAALFGAANLSMADACGQLLVNTITYAALGYCYFHFINLGETARRIRIIRELKGAETGLTINALLERYNVSEIIDKRLERLINNRQIVFRGGRYYIGNPSMLRISKIIGMFKRVLLNNRTF